MKFTLSWLEQFLDLENKSVDLISETLTKLGHEVEEIILPNKNLENFTVAYIKNAIPHPNADKLRVCDVETDNGVILQIVCGAPNARAGIKVVLAKVGIEIPNGNFKIKEAEIRGIKSQGMLCSLNELLLGEDNGGIIELPENTIIGKKITEYFNLDTIFDISTATNRADVLSVYGIARELATQGIGKLKNINQVKIKNNFETDFKIIIKNTELVPLYAAYEIKNITYKESPKWLKDLLLSVGIQPVSYVVDITNYINLSFGQPLHAYDKNKTTKEFFIDELSKEEKFLALDNKDYLLPEGSLVIKDQENIQALAGIIGAKISAIDENTNNIILESAVFSSPKILTTGRKLQINTESKQQFERGVDSSFTVNALNIATKMIIDFCGGEVSSIIINDNTQNKNPIKLVIDNVKKILGIEISIKDIKEILQKIGCDLNKETKEYFVIFPPEWRHDLVIEEDLIEEIIRIYGYEHIPMIEWKKENIERIILPSYRTNNTIKRALAATGYNEVITWSFMKKSDAEFFHRINDDLEIKNPINKDLSYLRPSILPNLLKIVAKNSTRGFKNLSLFELGPIFDLQNNNFEEKNVLTAIRTGLFSFKSWDTNERLSDVFDIKNDLSLILQHTSIALNQLSISTKDLPDYYHPTRSCVLVLGKKIIAYLGELHPKILKIFNINTNLVAFELYMDNIPTGKLKYGKKTEYFASDFQATIHDFAFLVDNNTEVGNIINFINKVNKDLVKEVNLFDIYINEELFPGKKSIAISVKIQSNTGNLNEVELTNLRTTIISGVKQNFNATLRE